MTTVPESLAGQPTITNIREQIKTLREKRDQVTTQDLDKLKINIAALPQKEQDKLTQEVRLLLKNLSVRTDIKVQLGVLEDRFSRLEQGLASKGLEVGGAFVGGGLDKAKDFVWSGGKRMLDANTWKEIWQTSNANWGSRIVGGSIAGYLVYRLVRLFKKNKSKKRKKSIIRRALGAASWVFGISLLMNTFGNKVEERAGLYAKQQERDKTLADKFRKANPNGNVDLFGLGADAKSMGEINLTQINVPFKVGGYTVKFERALSGEVLWNIDNKKFRIVSHTSWTSSYLSNKLSDVRRVKGSNTIRFRAGGKEYFVSGQTFMGIITELSRSSSESSQEVASINPAKPNETKPLSLRFALANTPAAPTVAG